MKFFQQKLAIKSAYKVNCKLSSSANVYLEELHSVGQQL